MSDGENRLQVLGVVTLPETEEEQRIQELEQALAEMTASSLRNLADAMTWKERAESAKPIVSACGHDGMTVNTCGYSEISHSDALCACCAECRKSCAREV